MLFIETVKVKEVYLYDEKSQQNLKKERKLLATKGNWNVL